MALVRGEVSGFKNRYFYPLRQLLLLTSNREQEVAHATTEEQCEKV